MPLDYNYLGSANGTFSVASNPLDSSGSLQNNVALNNNSGTAQGTAYFYINTKTDCDLTIQYQSYSNEDLIDDILTPGTYFNERYARVFYAVSDTAINIPIGNTINYYNGPPASDSSGNAVTWTPLTNSSISDTFVDVGGVITLLIQKNKYLYFLMSGPTARSGFAYTASLIISGLPSADGFCFGADSKILMSDGTYKPIKDIKRNDVVVQDINLHTTAIVSNVYKSQILGEMVKIPAGLIGNKEDIICTKLHPIWIGNKMRIYAQDLKGVELINGLCELYNLQFDEEGTFIVDGIKVDSLSPYHKYNPLPKELFIDQSKFIKGRKVRHENDSFRNKPPLRFNKILVNNNDNNTNNTSVITVN
jgi:hypothetical protein